MENKTAEEILTKIYQAQNCNEELQIEITLNPDKRLIIQAMKEYASQERLKGITEGFNAAREIEEYRYSHDDTGKGPFLATVEKYENINHYLNSKNKP